MCPRSEPSCSSTAQPRPLALSPSSSPSQLNSTHGRPSRRPWAQSIQPSTAMNRKLPVWSAWSSMKGGPHEVDRLEVPEVHLHDPPPTRRVHFVPPRLPRIKTRLELCLLLREQLGLVALEVTMVSRLLLPPAVDPRPGQVRRLCGRAGGSSCGPSHRGRQQPDARRFRDRPRPGGRGRVA